MSETRRRSRLAALIGAIGIGFAASGLAFWFALYRPRTTAISQAVLGIVVHVLFGYIVVMSGFVVHRSRLSGSECVLAAKRCVAGGLLMGALVVWRAVPELRSGAVGLPFLNELVVVSSVGAAAGALVGINRGRAERNRRLAAQKDDREETLVFLLRLLDHDIQNHLSAISGYNDTIDPESVDSTLDPVEGIENRTADIERLLETANAVLESETGEGESRRIDLSAVLREQVAATRADAPLATIETDIEDGLTVESSRFVGEVFHNILDNAVVHNSPAELSMSVSAAAVDGGVLVQITDDGDGIPDRIRDEVFDPGVRDGGSDGDGLGLYLARKLVESYGGAIEIADRSPSGTRFRVWFPEG
jgi:signal transduction histidine kinase